MTSAPWVKWDHSWSPPATCNVSLSSASASLLTETIMWAVNHVTGLFMGKSADNLRAILKPVGLCSSRSGIALLFSKGIVRNLECRIICNAEWSVLCANWLFRTRLCRNGFIFFFCTAQMQNVQS